MEYHIKLELFEGPLDLLLHLISKAKIKIEDISITEITEQYLNYLDKMKAFDVEVASDFLVMAATLLYIKSRALLPKRDSMEEEESDPEQELIKKLAEYKKYKEASIGLKERENIYSGVYYKLPEELLDKKEKALMPTIEGDVKELFAAFTRLISEKRFEKTGGRVYPIRREPITIYQRIHELEKIFYKTSECSFSELFHAYHDRSDVVITFLALLEMLKTNQVLVYQEKQFLDIIIRRAK